MRVLPVVAIVSLDVKLPSNTGERPRWNFHKYLISRDGTTVLSYGSMVSPDNRRFRADLQRLLREGRG